MLAPEMVKFEISECARGMNPGVKKNLMDHTSTVERDTALRMFKFTAHMVIFTASLRHESFSHNRVAIRRSLTDVGIRM